MSYDEISNDTQIAPAWNQSKITRASWEKRKCCLSYLGLILARKPIKIVAGMTCCPCGQFLLLLIIIKLILLKIRVRTVKFQIYEWQRATVSGANETRYFDETRHWQWHISSKSRASEMEKRCAFCIYKKQMRHWQWRVS
jgi:hypothetical protein